MKMESKQALSGSPAPPPSLVYDYGVISKVELCSQVRALEPDTSIPYIGINSRLVHKSVWNSKPVFREECLGIQLNFFCDFLTFMYFL